MAESPEEQGHEDESEGEPNQRRSDQEKQGLAKARDDEDPKTSLGHPGPDEPADRKSVV